MTSAASLSDSLAIDIAEVGFAYTGLRKATGDLKGNSDAAVISDLSFSISRGECWAVIGDNGTGKSTLLKLIAGILQPTSGTVMCAAPSDPTLLSLNLGYDLRLTGRENAFLHGLSLGFLPDDIAVKLPWIEFFSELEGVLDQPLDTYSLGMRSRLGFACGLAFTRDIVLIDELLSVGDISFQTKSLQALQDLLLGSKTCVLVSHNIQFLRKVADKCCYLRRDGRYEVGPAESIIDAYIAGR